LNGNIITEVVINTIRVEDGTGTENVLIGNNSFTDATSGIFTLGGPSFVELTYNMYGDGIDAGAKNSAIDASAQSVQLNNTRFLTGAGSPEGVVVGNLGDSYSRTDGGITTTLYIKETGNGNNTGWEAV